jgi:arsenical-resistance protein
MSIFERYLTLWVALCIVAGIALGHAVPGAFQAVGAAEVARVNLPVAVLIWLMVIPMLLKIDFAALGEVGRHWRGIGVTLFINWAVKPFSMAALGWLFVGWLFRPWLPADQIDSYIAGLIILAAAPCTAMVFVWSNLTRGEPHFTLSQVALNDAIMVVAFAPIVGLLLGLSAITVPWDTLVLSVVLYIVIPVMLAQGLRRWVLAAGGEAALGRLLQVLGPVSLVALLATLRADHRAAAGHRAAGRADPDPGLFQRRAGLPAEPRRRRTALRRRPFGPDRRVQLLRAGGRRRHKPVRLPLRRRARHRGRRADRGPGDADRRLDREPVQGLV